jgi:DNA-binding LacI/PurR family transcriptional regulator
MRVTQKDIAKALGLTQATVSMALSSDPSIPVETRQRVLLQAETMGYQPDPLLSRLASYRKRLRPTEYRGTLAWITNFEEREGWSNWPAFSGYFAGASERAASLGYRLEPFWLKEPNQTHQRISSILHSRGIEGLLLAPQQVAGVRLDLKWENFAAIQFGFTLAEPNLHIISRMHYRGMELVFRKLRDLGYRRPALHMTESSDLRTDHNWTAAFWSEQRNIPAKDRLPFFTEEPGVKTADRLKTFIQKHRPDVFISISGPFYQTLTEELRLNIPGEIGFAYLAVCQGQEQFAGLGENARAVGRAAVDFLAGMLHNGERGLPTIPVRLLLEGPWVEGPTVRPQS